MLGDAAAQHYVVRVGRTQLPPHVSEALRLEVEAQIAAGIFNQSTLAKAAKVSQPAVYKITARGEGGIEVGEKILKALGYATFDELIKKHQTRATANDVAIYLQKYPRLAETLREEATRWSIETLQRLIIDLRRAPRLHGGDGEPLHGTWAEWLDEVERGDEPKVLRAVRKFERPAK
jgi:hypothetical protein